MSVRRKGAIKFLKRESAEWVAMAGREMADPNKQEIGRIRLLLVAECLKVLNLMRVKQKS